MKLNKTQSEHLESILWLTSPSRREGKTYLLALAFIEHAVNNEDMNIHIFNHNDQSNNSIDYLLNEISNIWVRYRKNLPEGTVLNINRDKCYINIQQHVQPLQA